MGNIVVEENSSLPFKVVFVPFFGANSQACKYCILFYKTVTTSDTLLNNPSSQAW